MKQITVNKNDSGQRLDAFLGKLFRDAPKSLIYKWIRKKRIKINGKKAEISYRLAEGDEILLYINDEFFSSVPAPTAEASRAEIPLKIAYEDENILVADKQKGLSSQPDRDSHGESLVEYIRAYLFTKGEYRPEEEHTFAPQLCHRIDKNTEGLVIAAKNAAALRIINEKIRDREIRKFYLLRAEGEFKEKSGCISGYTKKDSKTNKVTFSFSPADGAKTAVTEYTVLDGGYILAELKTGRSHQIRASFAAIGHPLCGDVKYGAKKTKSKTYQNLCAAKIIFDFKTDAGILNYLKGKEITWNGQGNKKVQ